MTTFNESCTKKREDIMLRIQAVRGTRRAIASPLVSMVLGAGLAAYMSILVSVGDVFMNTMAQVDWSDRLSYAYSSLLHSGVVVQMVAGLIVSASFAVIINSIRSFRRMRVGF